MQNRSKNETKKTKTATTSATFAHWTQADKQTNKQKTSERVPFALGEKKIAPPVTASVPLLTMLLIGATHSFLERSLALVESRLTSFAATPAGPCFSFPAALCACVCVPVCVCVIDDIDGCHGDVDDDDDDDDDVCFFLVGDDVSLFLSSVSQRVEHVYEKNPDNFT